MPPLCITQSCIPKQAMDSYLSTYIQRHVKDTFCWNQPLIYFNLEGNIIVNFAEAVGMSAWVPYNAPGQPDHYLKEGKFWKLELIGSDTTTVIELKNWLCMWKLNFVFFTWHKSFRNTKIITLVMTNFCPCILWHFFMVCLQLVKPLIESLPLCLSLVILFCITAKTLWVTWGKSESFFQLIQFIL